MATALKNLSDYDASRIPTASDMRFAIVVSEWNSDITYSLLKGSYNTLIKHGASESQIKVEYVPGSFELTAGARMIAETTNYDAIICLGCIIRGETPHFDYICQSVAYGLTQLNINFEIPFVFGVLTTENMEQAKERSGGKHGNKGDEAAITAIKMVALKRKTFNEE